MTVAVVTLAIALAAALGVIAALTHRVLSHNPIDDLVDAGKRVVAAEEHAATATRDLAVRTKEVADRDQRIATLERELGIVRGERDRYRANAVAGLSDRDLRDLVNGVRADPDGDQGGAGSRTAAGTITVLDGAPADEPG